jgi:hypothetical protein
MHRWFIFTDVSGQPISPIFKTQAIQALLDGVTTQSSKMSFTKRQKLEIKQNKTPFPYLRLLVSHNPTTNPQFEPAVCPFSTIHFTTLYTWPPISFSPQAQCQTLASEVYEAHCGHPWQTLNTQYTAYARVCVPLKWVPMAKPLTTETYSFHPNTQNHDSVNKHVTLRFPKISRRSIPLFCSPRIWCCVYGLIGFRGFEATQCPHLRGSKLHIPNQQTPICNHVHGTTYRGIGFGAMAGVWWCAWSSSYMAPDTKVWNKYQKFI